MGGCIAGFDAVPGAAVFERLSGRHTRTDAVDPAAALFDCYRKGSGTVAGFRGAAGSDRAGTWGTVRFVPEYSTGADAVVVAWDSGVEFYRINRRGLDAR